MPAVRRALVAELASPLSPSVSELLRDFRLLVNLSLRHAQELGLTARASLVPYAQSLAREHRVRFGHARLAADVALSLHKGHRRRLRKGLPASLPYVRRPFLRADADSFHLDPGSGHLRLSLRFGEWAGLDLDSPTITAASWRRRRSSSSFSPPPARS